MAPHDDLLDLWSLSMKAQGLSAKTIRERLISVRSFLRTVPDREIRDVRKLDLLTFLSREDLSINSRATYRSTLSCFFRFLLDEELIENDPTLRLPRVRVKQPEPNPVTTEQIQTLVDSNIWGRTVTKVILYAYEGLRASEIAAVRGEDIDWEHGRLWVANAKGGRAVWRPMHSLTLSHLVAAEYPHRGFLFPSWRSGSGHVTGRQVSQVISEALQREGIAHRPHDLRKWHGTELLEQGADSLDVQHSLRHVDGQSMKAYVRPNERRIAAAKERLPRVRVPHKQTA